MAIGAGAVPLALIGLHGSPFAGTERSWVALGQQFASRHLSPGQNASNDYPSILARFFPGADSLAEAFVVSPGVFLTHVLQNMLEMPGALFQDVFSLRYSSVLSATGPAFLMSATLLIACLAAILVDLRGSRDRVANLVHRLLSSRFRVPLSLLILGIVASAIPVLVVFPRVHYLLLPAGFVLTGGALVLNRIGSQRLQWLLPQAVMLLLFTLLCAQTTSQLVYVISRPPAISVAARYLTESGRDWRLLGTPGLATYVPNVLEISDPSRDGESIADYIERQQIDVVLLSTDFDAAAWTNINGFDEFRSDPASLGFRQISPNSPVWIR